VPLVARHSTRSRAETRRHFALPADRPAVLLSFGGYGLPGIDLTAVDCLDRWTVVTTDRIATPVDALPASVRLIPEEAFVGSGMRYEDLVGAVDVVLTKPGFGITAECVSTGAAMLYTSRGHFREYDLLVREIPRYIRSRFIAQADLMGGRWRAPLDALLEQPAPLETMAADGASEVARAISDVLAASS
jgi:L-arabinokinase